MKTIISKYKIVTIHKNLLGEALHRNFLALQAEFGIANREGFIILVFRESIQTLCLKKEIFSTLWKEYNSFFQYPY